MGARTGTFFIGGPRVTVPRILALGATVLLAGAHLQRPSSATPAAAATFVIEVPGIPGPYCAYSIEKRLREIPGVAGVVMDWEAEELRVQTAGLSVGAVAAAVEASEYPYGYTVR